MFIEKIHKPNYFFRENMTNFKDGVVKDGSSSGIGKALGNIKAGVVRERESIFIIKSRVQEKIHGA